MNYMFVTSVGQIGGPTTYHATLGRELASRGDRVILIVVGSFVDPDVAARFTSSGIDVVRIRIDDKTVAEAAAELADLVIQYRPDVVVESACAMPCPIEAYGNVPVFAVSHTSLKGGEHQMMFNALDRFAPDRVAVVGPSIEYGSVVMFPGVDIGRCQPSDSNSAIRSRYGLPQDAKIILYHGRVSNEKIGVLMTAFAKTLELQPNAYLLIVGSGPSIGAIKTKASLLGFSHRMSITQTMPIGDALEVATCVAIPSPSESFSFSFFEAAAAGKTPVVCYRRTAEAIAEVIQLSVSNRNNVVMNIVLPYSDNDNAYSLSLANVLDGARHHSEHVDLMIDKALWSALSPRAFAQRFSEFAKRIINQHDAGRIEHYTGEAMIVLAFADGEDSNVFGTSIRPTVCEVKSGMDLVECRVVLPQDDFDPPNNVIVVMVNSKQAMDHYNSIHMRGDIENSGLNVVWFGPPTIVKAYAPGFLSASMIVVHEKHVEFLRENMHPDDAKWIDILVVKDGMSWQDVVAGVIDQAKARIA